MKKATLSVSSRFSRQSGAALLLALVILSLIMLVGVASLKQSVVQSRIVSNTNAAGVAFQAADTAIEVVMHDPEPVLAGLWSSTEVMRCVGQQQGNGCAPLNGPGQVQANSVTKRAENRADRPMIGSSTNTNVWRFYEVTGTGSVGSNAFAQVSNTQEFARPEIAMTGDIFDEKGSAAQ